MSPEPLIDADLEASEERYRHLVDHGFAIIATHDEKGRLLAIITKGHPDIGGDTEVCDVEVVKDRTEAASWFGLALIKRAWEPRQ